MTERAYEERPEGPRFVRYKRGAQMYDMCQSNFERLAKEAGATYKINKLVLVNLDVLNEYLELYRVPAEG